MRQAFTLIELSIVIVILGLLLGGTIVGKSLIRQAQLRAVTSDIQKFQTAIHAFRSEYNALAGDFTKATTFFGTNADCSAAGSGTQTCNGNGNNYIDFVGVGQVPPREQFLVWQHLASAGLIPGVYTGVSSSYAHCTRDVNCPRGPLTNDQTYYMAAVTSAPTTNWWPYDYANMIVIGSQSEAAPSSYPGFPILTASEALALDVKADDGLPGLGAWRSFGPGSNGTGYSKDCQINGTTGLQLQNAGNEQNDAVYNTANTDITCSMLVYFKL